MKTGILFDLDGTLLDTLADLHDSTNHVLAELGYPRRTLDEVRRFVGNGARRLMDQAVPAGVDAQEAFDAFQNWYPGHCQIKTKAYEGIPQALDILKEKYPIAIVSNKPDRAVKVLCADDILYPTSLEREMSALAENPDINLVSSDTALIDLEGRQVGAFKRFPVNGRMNGRRLARISLLFNNFFGAPCNNMFRREAALAVGGFDKNFPYILDFDLWLRLACTGDVYIIHETLNGFRLRNDSNTGEVMGTGEKGDVYVAEHGRLVDKHCSVLGIGKWGCGFSKWWRKTRSKIIHLYLKIKSNA